MKDKLVISLTLIIVTFFYVPAFGQDTTKSQLHFSVRYTFYYNYKVVHHVPVLSMDLGRHNLYIGPQYTYVLKPFGAPVDIYEKNSYGLNFGYRYYLKERLKKLQFFGQYNFSLYEYKYEEYYHAPPNITKHKGLIIENTGTIGLDYKIFKAIHLFYGIGIGSNGGFFLILDKFIPSTYLGIEYKF